MGYKYLPTTETEVIDDMIVFKTDGVVSGITPRPLSRAPSQAGALKKLIHARNSLLVQTHDAIINKDLMRICDLSGAVKELSKLITTIRQDLRREA